MAIRSQFFNSSNGDRIYTAGDFSAQMRGMASDGIIQENDSDALKVRQQTVPDNTIRVGLGACFIQGRYIEIFNEAETLTVPANNTGALRLDSVKIRVNFLQRRGELFYDTGTNLSQPAPTRNDQFWELILAQVAVPHGFTQVTQAMISDQRNDIFFCGKSKPTSLRQNFQNVPTSGWRRIAVTSGFFQTLEPQQYNIAFANFVIRTRNTATGQHDHMNICASALDGQPTLFVSGRNHNDAGSNISGVRLVYDSTFADERVALEVNLTNDTSICVYEIHDNYSSNGWYPLNWTAGSIPAGFSTIELNFTFADMVMGFATKSQPVNAFAVTRGGSIMTRADLLLDNDQSVQLSDTNFVYREYMKVDSNDDFQLGHTDSKMIQHSSTLAGLNIAGDDTQRQTFYLEQKPVARATQTNAQTVTNLVATKMNFQIEEFDTDNILDLGSSASDFTVQRDGFYHVSATFSLEANAAGTFRQIAILKNGDIVGQQRIQPPTTTCVFSVNTIIDAEENDVFTCELLHDAGVSLDTVILTNVPHMAIEMISSDTTLPV